MQPPFIKSFKTENPIPKANHEPRRTLHVPRFELRHYPYALSDPTNQVHNTKRNCHKAVEEALRTSYSLTMDFFALDNEQNIAVSAAEYYSTAISRYFSPISRELCGHCQIVGKEKGYHLLANLVTDSHKYLLRDFQEELMKSADTYTLKPLHHYTKKALLVKQCHKTGCDESRQSVIHRLIPRYKIISTTTARDALNDDSAQIHRHFFETVFLKYETYVSIIETVMEKTGVLFPEYGDGEQFEEFCRALKEREREVLGERAV